MIDFSNRLKSLKDRRQGSRERALLESSMEEYQKNRYMTLGFDSREEEYYESLKESDSVKYTIGAMAPVNKRSTEISFEEGERVAKSLIKSLDKSGISTEYKFQGSVALDIHIEKHSDVDVLIIRKDVIQVDTSGPGIYLSTSDKRNMLDIIKEIRVESEDILPKNFPETKVDISGNKSIAMSEGSLKRKVDVVPSCWYDTVDYQRSKLEEDRGIKIYHKGDHKLHLNLPFKHISLISTRDGEYNGNLRSVIRLMKNVVADMPDYKKKKAKKLSSYDLAAIAYHMETQLYIPYELRLGLVEKTRKHLEKLIVDNSYRNSLLVPDKSRKIFNLEQDPEKLEALKILFSEIDDLAKLIHQDLAGAFQFDYNPDTVLNKKIS